MRHAHVDRIVSLELGRCARALKCVSLRDEALGEHFPGNPVLPGVFLLEALAQTAGVLLWKSTAEERFAVMVSIDRARFVSFARPGDTVQLDVEIEERTRDVARIRCRASRDGRDVALSRMTFRLVASDSLIAPYYAPAYRQMIATWLGEYPVMSDA
jgi:3-hydroxyacyl-[acyl-carrier-protein] dehydratase